MRIIITIEDTERGVNVAMAAHFNGVQDHIHSSLAVMHTAQIQHALAHTVKCAHFNTEFRDPTPEDTCHPTRQNLLT